MHATAQLVAGATNLLQATTELPVGPGPAGQMREALMVSATQAHANISKVAIAFYMASVMLKKVGG